MKIFQKYALDFDAEQTQYIVFPKSSGVNDTLKSTEDGFTFSVWFKRKADNNNGSFFSFGEWYATRFRFWNDGRLLCQLGYGSLVEAGYLMKSFNSGVSYNDGNWHHWVVTWDGHNRVLYSYVDGNVDMDARVTKLSKHEIWSNLDKIVGAYSSVGSEPVNAVIGEIRIYDRPLTEEEIQYLYNGGHIEDGLVFWLYPNEEDVVLDDDGQTVLQVTERINGYVGTAYNGVKLVDGKDIDQLQKTKKVLVVKRV